MKITIDKKGNVIAKEVGEPLKPNYEALAKAFYDKYIGQAMPLKRQNDTL